jgi:hypothetical protein
MYITNHLLGVIAFLFFCYTMTVTYDKISGHRDALASADGQACVKLGGIYKLNSINIYFCDLDRYKKL